LESNNKETHTHTKKLEQQLRDTHKETTQKNLHTKERNKTGAVPWESQSRKEARKRRKRRKKRGKKRRGE
jgi:hypothetical protein